MRLKALVLGCTGQDGSYMTKYLLGKGYEVVGTSRSTQKNISNHEKLGIKGLFLIKKINLLNFDEIKNLLLEENPNEIYNFSAQSSVGKSFDFPIETQQSISLITINILEACKKINFKGVIFFSGSSEIYGETLCGAKIDSEMNPQNPYAIAKVESFLLVKHYRELYDLRAVTGILFPHESPLRNSNFITHKITSAAVKALKDNNYKIKIGNLNIERDWGWAEEYIKAIHLIANTKNLKDQIICTGQPTKLRDFIDLTFKLLDLDWKNHIISDPSLLRERDINISFGDPSQMLNDLNWETTSKIEDIIKRLLKSKINNS